MNGESKPDCGTTALLSEAQLRWRQLFEQAPGFVCVLAGPQHVLEFANPMYFRLVGRDDIIGKPVHEALPWVQQQEQGFVDLLDRVYTSGEPYNARSAPIVLPGVADEPGQSRYMDFVYQPVRDEHGQVNGIFVSGSDVTERQQAEDALRRSEEQLRLACDASALGIHDFNVETGIITWDQRIRTLWGVGADEVITYDTFEAGIHPNDRELVRAQVDRGLDAAGDGRYAAEFRVINRQTGVTRWIQSLGRMSCENGRAARLVGTAQDITERKMADARRTEFLATLGHELRNPLAPIANAVALLRRQFKLSDTTRQAYDLIDRQLSHMVRLLEDLLDVVRISKGRIEFRNSIIRLREVIRLAVETAVPHVERGNYKVVIAAPEIPVCVYADSDRLAQVFANLLINSCKYSEKGSRIEITVDSPENGFTAVRVRDHGIGIAPEHMQNLFDIFSQVEPSLHRSEGGLGIGLSLAKGLVEAQGGTIEVHSEGLMRGSEFIVRLPVIEGSVGDELQEQTSGKRASGRLRGLRVLVVDDNRDAAQTLGQLLEFESATVAVSHDSTAALRTADAFLPHIVVLDIGLPGMNGYEVCRTLRLRPWAKSVRIVALTGWGQEGDRMQSREAGFDEHLVKPIDFEHLLRAILLYPSASETTH
jgi:PAS domain S-box-containing protein